MGDLSDNFNRDEFACKCGCGENKISLNVIEKLQYIRNMTRIPIKINSGYRCEKHNKEIKGKPNSTHLKGLAVDIAIRDLESRHLLLTFFLSSFDRVGIGNNFIHGDIDKTEDPICWLY